MSDREDTSFITYCGLFCGDCHGYTGTIPDLARDLRKELRKARYDKFAEAISRQPFGRALSNYKECYEALGMMVKFRCKKGCKNGGGPPFCKIRKCCQSKEIDGCWGCVGFEDCDRLGFLIPVHGDAHIKNLQMIKKKGVKAFLQGKRYWYSEIKK